MSLLSKIQADACVRLEERSIVLPLPHERLGSATRGISHRFDAEIECEEDGL